MKNFIFNFLKDLHYTKKRVFQTYNAEWYFGFYPLFSYCNVGNGPDGYMKRRLVLTWNNRDLMTIYI